MDYLLVRTDEEAESSPVSHSIFSATGDDEAKARMALSIVINTQALKGPVLPYLKEFGEDWSEETSGAQVSEKKLLSELWSAFKEGNGDGGDMACLLVNLDTKKVVWKA